MAEVMLNVEIRFARLKMSNHNLEIMRCNLGPTNAQTSTSDLEATLHWKELSPHIQATPSVILKIL